MKKTYWVPILSILVAILLTASLCWLSVVGQARLPRLTTRQQLNRQGAWVGSKDFLQLDAINLNAADISELQELPGIGPILSQRIVDYRDEHGTITDIDELETILGIGKKTLRTLRERGYIVPAKVDNQ